MEPRKMGLAHISSTVKFGVVPLWGGGVSRLYAFSLALKLSGAASGSVYGTAAFEVAMPHKMALEPESVQLVQLAESTRLPPGKPDGSRSSFEWVGRAINPYLGFLTGWLMIAAYIIATVSGVEVLGPSVLSVFGSNSTSLWANIAIGTAVGLIMLVIAVVGIKITARAQVGMAVVEYGILVGFAIVGLVAVLAHHHGTLPMSRGWLSLHGIGGKGSAAAGFLTAVFIFTGWDGTLYVNEEVRHRRTNPGRAAILAVAFLAIIYTLSIVGLQGAVSPAKLQKNSTSALVYIAQAPGGGDWAMVMALGLALSVIATTGTGIVLTAQIGRAH